MRKGGRERGRLRTPTDQHVLQKDGHDDDEYDPQQVG